MRRIHASAFLAIVSMLGCSPGDQFGVAHNAETGHQHASFTLPMEAQCSILGTSVAIVPAWMFDETLPFPFLLATSCYGDSSVHNKITYTDPITGAFVRQITTDDVSELGWGSLALRGNKEDMIGCTSNLNGVHKVYSIDIKTGATAELITAAPGAHICDGVSWDAEDNSFWQSPDVADTFYHFNEAGTELGHWTSPAGCPNSGIGVSGPNVYLACNGEKITFQVLKSDPNTVITSFTSGDERTEDLECDPFTFPGFDVIWSKEAFDNKVFAWEIPRGTCNIAGAGTLPQPATQTTTCCPTAEQIDSDQDGLLDCWEKAGGIDFDCSGTGGGARGLDYLFPTGADAPNYQHKDVYVELDYTTGFTPFSTALTAVKAAFNNATTVTNAAGGPGITLHFVDGEAVGATGATRFASQCSDMSTSDPTFDARKLANFGTAAQRADATTLAAKKMVFRYGLIVNSLSNHPNTMGCAEVPGDDFIIAREAFFNWDSDNLAGVLMHELGHTLNRRHGGSINRDKQANFVSNMNSNLILPDINAARALNFSVFQTGWSEAGIVERSGIPQTDPALVPVSLQTAYWCAGGGVNANGVDCQSGKFVAGLTKEAIGTDYNGNDTIETAAYVSSFDMDQDGTPGNGLPGGEDWTHLVLDFRLAYDYAAGVHLSTLSMAEELPNTYHLEQSGDDDGDGVPNVADNCILAANVDQADANDNGIGDACEIIPSVCIIHSGNRDDLRAVFSYNNPNLQQVYPVGPENFLSPGGTIVAGAQPTLFATGFHPNVFQVAFDHKSTLTWTVGGNSATADISTPNCKFKK